jgi:diguanylate cyclase (GGDEF)-like protein
MTQGQSLKEQQIPHKMRVLSLFALLVPIVGALALPPSLSEVGAVLWLFALVPAFILGYWRGLREAAASVAVGLALIAATEVVAWLLRDRPPTPLLAPVAIAFAALGLGVGRVTGLLHSERETIRGQALTDNVTGLPNRRYARAFLETEFAAARRGQLLSVVLFDLDRFKSFNDLHGHRAGDRALERFGELLSSTTRKMDLSSRFGGEEFLTILPGSGEAAAVQFAERVRQSLEGVRLPQGSLTVSSGVASYHPSMRSPDELTAAADLALYRAKRDGRNRVRVFGRADDGEAPGATVERDPLSVRAGDSPGSRGRPPAGYPRADEDVGHSPPPPELLPAVGTGFGSGRSVWLVGGEEDARVELAGILAGEGFAVAQAAHPGDRSAGTERHFDVVVVEPGPGASSYGEWVVDLKARWPATQLILATPNGSDPMVREALAAGADRHVSTPFDALDVKSWLVDALARRDRALSEGFRKSTGPTEVPGVEDPRSAILTGARLLVRAVELRDPNKRGHAERVAGYAEAILGVARSGVAGIQPEALRLACELHDVGEIGVPEDVLTKAGPLSSAELALVREHPLIGTRILTPLLANETVLVVTRSHHERWDGSGYPDGLSQEAIPLPARIVALADALEAMTSPRAYRSALPWESAVDQILALGGSQFDPQLVASLRVALPALERLHRVHTAKP